MLLQYYKTYIKLVIGYGLLNNGCTSKNRLKSNFILQKKIQRQICYKVHCYPSAELSDEFNVLNVYDFYNVELLQIFLKSVRSVQSTENHNSLYARKVSNVQTRKAQPNLFSLPNESCTVSHNFLRYRGAKVINCFLEIGLGTSLGLFLEL